MPLSERLSFRAISLFLLLLALVPCRVVRAAETPAKPPEVDVILWFDTEDYLLLADDDADKRLAEMLTQRGIRATFKVVGEKARVLEARHRTDVIEALKKHEIGFHANFHSVHPTPTEYLADCGLLDGMQEFVRREGPGAADVRRIFNVPSLVCYGQPGSSWASQTIAALGECGISNDGIPCYVDSGTHVGVGGKPFWYEGALVVYRMAPNETRMDLYTPGGLARGNGMFDSIARRLASEGGGLISIYYHPCEWVMQEFWDSVNFKHGANPPREDWKAPRQRPVEETEKAFERFGAYVDHMKAFPGVRFVTAHDLPKLYPDHVHREGASDAELTEIANRIVSPKSSGLDDQVVGDKVFSPADQFALLAFGVGKQIDDAKEPGASGAGAGAGGTSSGTTTTATYSIPMLLGPDGDPPAEGPARDPLPWRTFRDVTLDVRNFIQVRHRIPARVFIGPDPIPPADFAPALAAAYLERQQKHEFPSTIALGHGIDVLTTRYVADDSPSLFGGWVIHKEGFRAPKVMHVAKLQAWTLKPATRE